MRNYKTIVAVTITVLFFTSCKKAVQTNALSFNTGSLVLQPLQVSGNLVTLNWTKLDSNAINYYTIVKITDTINNAGSSTDVSSGTSQFVDTLPLHTYVQYYVVANQTNPIASYSQLSSNRQTFVRTDLTFINIKPADAIYDKTSHYLYIFGSKSEIAVYDVINKKVLAQININGTIGYCDVGSYNGRRELYVPNLSNEVIYIYDAATLNQIDTINAGISLIGVSYNNGILFYHGPYISISRATKTRIANSPYGGYVRLKLIPGTNSEFLGIGDGSSINDALFFSNGQYDTSSQVYVSTSVSQNIFEVYGDGSGFISGSDGIIYNKNLTYKTTLSTGNYSFLSFGLDDTNRVIYAACNANKLILGYSMDSYQLSKTIKTQGYPYRVFYDNGSTISLSLSIAYQPYYYPSDPTYCFVEQY